MQRINSILLFFFIAFSCTAQDVYSLTFNTADGKTVSLKDYRGKKLLFITVPLNSSDTAFSLTELSALQTKYATSLVVIGVPMIEEGYKTADASRLKALYKNQKSNFILAEGMKVMKSSGAEQSSLYQWLTDMKKNRHYSIDIKGVGYKIFVDEGGRQYAVMPPQVKLSNPVIDKILSTSMPSPKVRTTPTGTTSTQPTN